MKRTITTTFSQTALMLLVMMLTAQTAWADDIVITSANFTDYFDYDGDYDLSVGKDETVLSDVGAYFLKDAVAEGTTLDFKGDFTPPTDGKNPRIFINKRVNITSSDKSAVFKSGDTGLYWFFGMIEGADQTEVKNLQFDNCWVFVHGSSYVTLDGIDMKVHDAKIGYYYGALSIATLKEGGPLSEYATIKNSHFYVTDNGQSACVVLGCGASHATVDNNTIEVGSNVGNMLYATVFLGTGVQPEFITFSNNVVTRGGASTAVSWGIIVCGQGNVVENNTVNYAGVAITTTTNGIFSENPARNTYRNNTVNGGGSMKVLAYSDVENNHVSGPLVLDLDVVATCNTASQINVNRSETILQSNTVYGKVRVNNVLCEFTGNVVLGAMTFESNIGMNTFTGNAIFSSDEYAIQKGKVSKGNTIEYNWLVAAEKRGDEAVDPAIGTENTIQNNLTDATIITSETTTLTATDNGAFYYVPANTSVIIPSDLSVTGSAGQRVNIILAEGATLTINGQLSAKNKVVGVYALTNDETKGKMTMNTIDYQELFLSSGIVTVGNEVYDTGHYGVENNAKTTYTVDLASEFTSVPSIYAGCPNYLSLNVENTGAVTGSNIHASVYADGMLVWEGTIASLPAGEKTTLEVEDPTIRPVTENTVIGNDNADVVYKVVLEDDGGANAPEEFSFVILYNGNLSKEYAYTTSSPLTRDFSFTGDVLVLNGNNYSTSSATSREDAFAVDLDGGSVHKALLYVSYNWDKVAEGDFKTWTTAFNGQTIAPIANYRDQGNLGKYGSYGYGLVVYDVTACVNDGDNTFTLEKTASNVAVYPSSLVVMVEKASAKQKTVYIVEEADLLSKQYNKNVEANYHSQFKGVVEGDAKLYVFAANAQSGEGNLKINDDVYEDVWIGTSQSVEVYEASVAAGDVNVQFISTGSTILAIQQMLVVEESDGGNGDANGDGTVNAADIVEVVNYIMGNASDKFNVKAADANNDKSVNAADIVTIVNIIMGH